MIYYRVKPEYDQRPRLKKSKFIRKCQPDGFYVANELYTAGELTNKYYVTEEQVKKMFERVQIPKNKIYWVFGCRFGTTS